MKASRTLASGWVLGIIAGCTRAETAGPSGPFSSAQIASSLTTQPISAADATSLAVTSAIPSRWTSAAVTRVWKARLARIAALAAASKPSTSAVGSASAYPSAWASSSASLKPAPELSIRSRMKLVVPLTMPSTRVTWSPASDSRSGRRIGMAPATAAS